MNLSVAAGAAEHTGCKSKDMGKIDMASESGIWYAFRSLRQLFFRSGIGQAHVKGSDRPLSPALWMRWTK